MIVALDQMKAEIQGYEQTMHEVEASLDIVNKEKKIEERVSVLLWSISIKKKE